MTRVRPRAGHVESPTLFDEVVGSVSREIPSTGPRGPSVRVRMTVAYHGAGFAGFAVNPGLRTVGGVLTEALERVLGRPITLACAGRTDAGVHAWGQVVSFDTDHPTLDLVHLSRSINKLCAPAVAVRDAAIVAKDFDARHSAVARSYRYTIMNRPEPNPFSTDTAWHVPMPLDLSALRLGCDPLIGSHDFSAFCRRPKVPEASIDKPLVRRVQHARWHDLGDGWLRFDIEAGAFCHQMVRSIVGTLVEMGSGKKRPGDMSGILRSRDRSRAGQVAPPHGLMLWQVRYGDPRDAADDTSGKRAMPAGPA